MIKVGILEAASAQGAELVRILLNHPDVDIKWAQSSVAQGPLCTSIRGITGETTLTFSRQASSPVDVIINCSTTPVAAEVVATASIDPAKIRVIEMSASELPDSYVYGLCEMNRKTLVRGALLAYNPSPLSMAVELALLPLAKHLMLNSPIYVSAAVGVNGTTAISRRGVGHIPECDEIAAALRLVQSSFYQRVNIVELRCGSAEGLVAVVSVRCPMPIGELRPLYEKTYEDHNFVFVSTDTVDSRDVAGTNKCLLHLDKEDDILRVTAVLDPRVKGSAGNAVHLLNLMFGLHERTGLALISVPE